VRPLGKTIRNIVDGSLRALCRDARRIDQLWVSLDPFENLQWPRSTGTPTLTEGERNRLLAWYARKLWRVEGSATPQPWPAYDAYLYTLFFTGMRPSELSAIRIVNLSVKAGTIRVIESIDDGEIGDVKTRSSDRTVRLTEENAMLLERLVTGRTDLDGFVFLDVHGRPVNGGAFYNGFVKAQRDLGISPVRDLYSTKDTYISVCLSAPEPVNLCWLSEQTGVSESTIKRHYGRFMHHPDRDALELRKIRPPTLSEGSFDQTSVAPSGEQGATSKRGETRKGRVAREGSAGRSSGKRRNVWPSRGPNAP
jgi:integrase